MQYTEQQARPPYFRFRRDGREDRAASIEAGHYIAKDVDVVLITPRGSKDCIERDVAEYLPYLQQQVRAGRFEQSWLNDFKASYAAWQEGLEIPESGFPLRNWPLLSPSQLSTLLNVQVRTVEDLAEANEEILARIGMGGRVLKEKAKGWLAAGQDSGKLAERITALETSLQSAIERNKLLEEKLAATAAQLQKAPQLKPAT